MRPYGSQIPSATWVWTRPIEYAPALATRAMTKAELMQVKKKLRSQLREREMTEEAIQFYLSRTRRKSNEH